VTLAYCNFVMLMLIMFRALSGF